MYIGRINSKELDLKSKMLIFWLSELFILTLLRFVLTNLGYEEGVLREVIIWSVASLPLIYFLLNISKIKLKTYLPFVILILIVIIVMLLSVLLNPKLSWFFVRPSYGIERILRPDCAIFAFLFFYMIDDGKKLRDIIVTYAYVYFIYLVILHLIPALIRGYWIDIGPDGIETQFTYNLSFGYSVAFPVIVFLYDFIKNKKIYSLLFLMFSSWSLITQGNRGALLIVLVYVGLLIFKNIKNSKYVALKTSMLLLFMILLIIYGKELLFYTAKSLNNLGIESRNIKKILNGSFSDDNGRDIIWSTVAESINSGGILGHGMLGDRPFVFPLHYAGYSHNIFLELLSNFGLLGILISIYLIFKIVRMLFICDNEDWYNVYIIFLSCSVQLLLSMSFWYVWQFWATLAISSKYFKLKKEKTNLQFTKKRGIYGY